MVIYCALAFWGYATNPSAVWGLIIMITSVVCTWIVVTYRHQLVPRIKAAREDFVSERSSHSRPFINIAVTEAYHSEGNIANFVALTGVATLLLALPKLMGRDLVSASDLSAMSTNNSWLFWLFVITVLMSLVVSVMDMLWSKSNASQSLAQVERHKMRWAMVSE